MSAVFNSLGSNYSSAFVQIARDLLFGNKKGIKSRELTHLLSDYLPAGDFYYYYKGRDAIAAALTLCTSNKNKKVFTQAFACYAIEEAISRAGFETCYIDIASDSLNVNIETLESGREKYGVPAVVLVQHSLGAAADIGVIRDWCDKHKVVLIEDLAQSFGAKDKTGKYLGTTADFVIGSFGRDKVIDAISGGFLFVPKQAVNDLQGIKHVIATQKLHRMQIIKDLLYPVVTQFFRKQYPSLIAKIVLAFAKKISIITTPLEAPTTARSLPDEYQTLAVQQLSTLQAQQESRRKKALYYYTQLDSISHVVSREQIMFGANLRFPLLVHNPSEIVDECKRSHIFISDRWYREPVDCSTLQCDSMYEVGSCVNAEYAAKHIINLPTHMYVNEQHMAKIVKIIKKYS